MALPISYTEDTLASYIRDGILRGIAKMMGWLATSDYQEIINDTLLRCGNQDISAINDVALLRRSARIEAWKAVAEATAGYYTFAVDGGNYNREQIHQHALEMYNRAIADALGVDDTPIATSNIATAQPTW